MHNAIPDTNHNANPTNPNRYSKGNPNPTEVFWHSGTLQIGLLLLLLLLTLTTLLTLILDTVVNKAPTYTALRMDFSSD